MLNEEDARNMFSFLDELVKDQAKDPKTKDRADVMEAMVGRARRLLLPNTDPPAS